VKQRIVHESVGGEDYVYRALGKYIVSAPAVCRGRPTFKYTRIEVAGVLERLGAGHSLEQLIAGYRGRISREAIAEATQLAGKALELQSSRRSRTSGLFWTNSSWAMDCSRPCKAGIADR